MSATRQSESDITSECDEQFKTIRSMWNAEFSLAEIGEALGISRQTVWRRVLSLRDQGADLQRRPASWKSPKRTRRYERNAERNAKILALAFDDAGTRRSYAQIAHILSLFRGVVSGLMRRERKKWRKNLPAS